MKFFLAIASLVFVASSFGQNADLKVPPSFSLAWSEYPSWSILDVASTYGLIDGRKGKLGPIEKKHGVDIELKLLDYDPCIQAYSSNNVDAVCITNIDVLSSSLGRKSVAILPTSTSYGGDALVVPSNITSIDELKGQTVYGLGKSVSEYVFVSVLEKNGIKANSVIFSSMDPSQVSLALQGNDSNVKYGIVWNPFILDVLKKRKDMKVLFSSSAIPFEVIDMVVVGNDVLSREGGPNFAKAICETYYAINARLNDKEGLVRDETLVAIGTRFSSLGLADMRKVVNQTRFFGTAEQGCAIFNNEPLSVDGSSLITGYRNGVVVASDNAVNLKTIMNTVVDRSRRIGIIEKDVTIGYGNSEEANKANLRFDPQYMISVSTKPATK